MVRSEYEARVRLHEMLDLMGALAPYAHTGNRAAADFFEAFEFAQARAAAFAKEWIAVATTDHRSPATAEGKPGAESL